MRPLSAGQVISFYYTGTAANDDAAKAVFRGDPSAKSTPFGSAGA